MAWAGVDNDYLHHHDSALNFTSASPFCKHQNVGVKPELHIAADLTPLKHLHLYMTDHILSHRLSHISVVHSFHSDSKIYKWTWNHPFARILSSMWCFWQWFVRNGLRSDRRYVCGAMTAATHSSNILSGVPGHNGPENSRMTHIFFF